MKFNEVNIPHQYRSKYWRGGFNLDDYNKKSQIRKTVDFQYIYGTFRFDPETGLLYAII